MKVLEPAAAVSAVAERATSDVAAPHAVPEPPCLRLHALCKRYGGFEAVKGASLDVHRGEFVTLLGPSGSGKTTTLMMIAGFVEPTSGRIEVDGRDVTDEPPNRRNIGMVFQNYALFPHLTVFRNVAFPLEVRKRPAAEIRARTMEALEVVKLADFGERFPGQLSGGQQQRVALARAIVFGPPLLLMDEPLGALDKKLREHMQIELLKIQDRLGVTVIYVTHDQEEALVMSDRVVVMSDGVVQQIGWPDQLYRRPANRFVADFIGETNLIEGKIVRGGARPSISLLPGLVVEAPSEREWQPGEQGFVVVRPECMRVGPRAEACTHRLEAVVERVIYVGDVSRVLLNIANGQTLVAKLQNSGDSRPFEVGERVAAGWDADSTWLVAQPAPATGEAIPKLERNP